MKRLVSGLIAITMIGGLLAGCGTAKNTNDNTASTAGASSTSTDGTKPAGGEKKKAELNIMFDIPRFKDQLDRYIKQFAEKNNYDLTYDLSMPSGDKSGQLIKAKLASGGDVDIFAAHAVNDLPAYVKAGYAEDLSAQPFVSKLLDGPKKAVTIDDKVYAVPMESVVWGYLYNKKIFGDLGLKPATTLTEMREVVSKLKANNITPFLLTYKDSWVPQLVLTHLTITYYNKIDKDFIAKMNEGKSSFSNLPQIFDVFDLINENGNEKKMFDIGADDGCAEFANGKAAMWFQGAWMSDSIVKANKDFEFGMAAFPMDDDTSHTCITLGVSTTVVVNSSAKNKEVAIQFINYMLDDQDSSGLYQSMQFNPVATMHTYSLNPWIMEGMEYVKAGNSAQEQIIPSKVKDDAGTLLQQYASKKISKDDVVKGLDDAWKTSVANSNE